MRELTLTLLLLAAACDGRLVRIETNVAVGASALEFGPAVVGQTRTLPLEVSNASRAPAVVHLSAPAPFALELDLTLAAG